MVICIHQTSLKLTAQPKIIMKAILIIGFSLILVNYAITQQKSAAKRPNQIGDIVDFAGDKFQVHSYRFASDESGEEYVIVDVTLWNKSQKEVTFSVFDELFTLLDAEGRTYKFEPMGSAYGGIQHDEEIESIPAGEKRRGEYIFRTPKTTKFSLLFYPPSRYFGKSKPIKVTLSNANAESNEKSEIIRNYSGEQYDLQNRIVTLYHSAETEPSLSVTSLPEDSIKGDRDTTLEAFKVVNSSVIEGKNVTLYVVIPQGSDYVYGSATWDQFVKPILLQTGSGGKNGRGPVVQIKWKFLKAFPSDSEYTVRYKAVH